MLDTALPSQHAALPDRVAAAIGDVMTEVATRSGNRSHTDMVAELRPLCAAAGLILGLDELTLELLKDPVSEDARTWLKATYALTVGHRSRSVWMHRPRRTVILPFDGGSCTWQAQQQALRQLLEGLFLLSCRGPGCGQAAGAPETCIDAVCPNDESLQ